MTVSRPTIGIDSYSYHRYFGDPTRWERPLDPRWTIHDVLRHAVELGVDAVSLQTVYLPPLDADGAEVLRQMLADAHLMPTLAWGHRSGLEGGANPAKVAAAMDAVHLADALGCSVLRIVCGEPALFHTPSEPRVRRLSPIVREIAQEAARCDLTIAVENHADLRVADVVHIVEAAGEPNVGLCFDTVNAVRTGDDLIDAGRMAAPLIRMVHFKDVLFEGNTADANDWWPNAPLGKGQINVEGFYDILTAQGYTGTLFVEIANLFTDWPDDLAVIAENVAAIRRLLNKTFG